MGDLPAMTPSPDHRPVRPLGADGSTPTPRGPYDDLAALLAEAFPAGWEASGRDWEERLRRGWDACEPAARARVHRQVDALLSGSLCEPQLADLLAFELDCHLEPARLGMTVAEWLHGLRGLLG